MYFMKTLLFVFILASLVPLNAQEVYSLEKCVKIALQKSLALQQSDLTIQDSELSYNQARSNRKPNLNASNGFNINFGRSIDPTTNTFITERVSSNNLQLNSNILIYNGGRLNTLIKQSELNYDAASLDKQQAEADIALQVATAYLNSLFAKENISVAKNQLKQSEEQLNFINKLIKAGARPANESLDILAQISINEQSIALAQNSLEIALLQLKQLMTLPPNEVIELVTPDNLEGKVDPDLLSFEEAYELTLRTQPSVKASETREKSAAYNIDIAKSGQYPTLSAGVNLGTPYSSKGVRRIGSQFLNQTISGEANGVPIVLDFQQEVPAFESATFFQQLGDNLYGGVGFFLSIPIYSQGTNKNNIQRAKLGLKSSEIATLQLKENIQILIQQVLLDARAAKRSMAATEKTLEARKAAFENAQKKFENGALNAFDLTTSQSLYDDAATNALIEKYNYLFRIIILEFYTGKSLKF